jgi:NAD(P)-dependent dehydrogenase (short-subunit alcohol dehydrogenase family)
VARRAPGRAGGVPHAPRLAGRRVLLTGASSDVGSAAARLLHEEGARIALLARDGEALQEVARSEAPGALPFPVDLGDHDAARRATEEAIAALGGVDVVVSNAGVAVFGHALEVSQEEFDRTVDVTFGGAVAVIRAALPHLRASRGAVVATGSLMAKVPLPTWSAYSAAKHALRGWLNSVRVEEREQGSGVRVCMVHPGPIDTPLFSQATTTTGFRPRVPPDAYGPEVVAQALVECAVDPRRAEVSLGGTTRLIDLLFAYARPAAEGLLVLIDRWYVSGDVPPQGRGSLWEPPAQRGASGGIPARDSLFAPVQLGRRMAPAPATPLRFVAHLVQALPVAVRVRRGLLHRREEVRREV